MSYYPSQGSYAQPVVYPSSHHSYQGHGPSRRHHRYSSDNYYAAPVTYVPTQSSSRRRRRHHSHHDTPTVTVMPTAPIVVQPSHTGSHGRHHHRHHYGSNYYPRSFGERVRHFFGLAPRANYRYKSSRSSWGFMGYSPRPRYYDEGSGREVDKHGRPIYRV